VNAQALADELNVLLTTEDRGLVRHLERAKPYLTPRTFPMWAQVQQISRACVEHSARITRLLESLEASPAAAPFNTVVASYHFVTLESLIPLLIAEKRSQIDSYRRCIEHVGNELLQQDIRLDLETLLAQNIEQLQQLESMAHSLTNGATTTAAH